MSNFRTVAVFECENKDVYAEMCKSIAYVQTIYCFPFPSEFFESMKIKSNESKDYVEQEIVFHSEEKYKEWFEIFGSILEELIDEMNVDFEKSKITYRRFFQNIEISRASRAEPLENFQTKFTENYKAYDFSS